MATADHPAAFLFLLATVSIHLSFLSSACFMVKIAESLFSLRV
jgi:hypothetical protein